MDEGVIVGIDCNTQVVANGRRPDLGFIFCRIVEQELQRIANGRILSQPGSNTYAVIDNMCWVGIDLPIAFGFGEMATFEGEGEIFFVLLFCGEPLVVELLIIINGADSEFYVITR